MCTIQTKLCYEQQQQEVHCECSEEEEKADADITDNTERAHIGERARRFSGDIYVQ